ncbi:MAG TPA: hypothetical protein VHX64_14465, partial [Caulobacteraceae bacterium]|nr:hypothetical protein [Caulobacteraceae bacterium]
MRPVLFPALLAALVIPAIGAAEAPSATAPQHSPPVISPPPTTPPTVTPPPPPDRLLTPEQLGRQGVMKGVIEQPFRDFNLMHSKIPPVLIEAMADAYERPSP